MDLVGQLFNRIQAEERVGGVEFWHSPERCGWLTKQGGWRPPLCLPPATRTPPGAPPGAPPARRPGASRASGSPAGLPSPPPSGPVVPPPPPFGHREDGAPRPRPAEAAPYETDPDPGARGRAARGAAPQGSSSRPGGAGGSF